MTTQTRTRGTPNTEWHPRFAVKMARIMDGVEQAELAVVLAESTGRSWDQTKVSRIERGVSPMTWEHLVAIASAQGRPVEWYVSDRGFDRAKGLSRDSVEGIPSQPPVLLAVA